MDVLTLFAINVINHTYRAMSEFKMFPTKEDGTKDYLKQISVSLAHKKIRLACSKFFVPLAFLRLCCTSGSLRTSCILHAQFKFRTILVSCTNTFNAADSVGLSFLFKSSSSISL